MLQEVRYHLLSFYPPLIFSTFGNVIGNVSIPCNLTVSYYMKKARKNVDLLTFFSCFLYFAFCNLFSYRYSPIKNSATVPYLNGFRS